MSKYWVLNSELYQGDVAPVPGSDRYTEVLPMADCLSLSKDNERMRKFLEELRDGHYLDEWHNERIDAVLAPREVGGKDE